MGHRAEGPASRPTGAALFAAAALPGAAGFATDWATGTVLAVAVLLLLIVAGLVLAKLVALGRRRVDGAAHLQAAIASSLRADPALAMLPITATTRTPFWGVQLVTIDVRGAAPTPKRRDDVLALAIREATRSGLGFRIVDRMVVVPTGLTRQAA